FAGPCDFERSVGALDQLPEFGAPEVAFAGRSNVGKSSLINALTGRKTLARTSNTPGRTQTLIFFSLGGRLRLVDLPGYGYARVSKALVARWTRLLKAYLAGRAPLRLALLLVDSRHGLKETDREIMTMLDQAAVPYRVVLTKADKPGSTAIASLTDQIQGELSRHPAAFPTIMATSSRTGYGIEAVRAELAQMAEPAR
ncbi:MAG: ribosome biogenesis GTP-binding protein YihA/YsxC, partial [Pseudomonadota bacterium]